MLVQIHANQKDFENFKGLMWSKMDVVSLAMGL